MAKKKEPKPPACAECGGVGERVTGKAIYPHRPDLHDLTFWRCRCGAYVGTHKNTNGTPLGTCAGPEARKARNLAHSVFDPLWKAKMKAVAGCTQKQARTAAYMWLSDVMDMKSADCHISMMTAEQARSVYDICKPYYDRIKGALQDG